MITSIKKLAAISIVLAASVLTSACTSPISETSVMDAITAIEKVVNIADTVAVAFCSVASGLTPVLTLACGIADTVLAAAGTGNNTCAAELATMDTTAEKWTACTAAYKNVVVPQLPAGTPLPLIATLNALPAAVGILMAILQPSNATPPVTTASLSRGGAYANAGATRVKFSMSHRHQLSNIAKEGAAIAARHKK